jgi:ATP-binding cassette subfamily F protein 3
MDHFNSKQYIFLFFSISYGLAADLSSAEIVCSQLWRRLQSSGAVTEARAVDEEPQVLGKAVTFSDISKTQISDKEQEAMDKMWGFDKIRGKVNDTIELNEAGNAMYERRAQKEQKQWLTDLEQRFVGEEDDGNQISAMLMPDLSGNSNEKDIHVHNFNITFGGRLLLDCADLRIVYGRRYGLVGRNGIGKTTLLKHMAAFDIEGFPRHHRVLHVKQEVKSSEESVLAVGIYRVLIQLVE